MQPRRWRFCVSQSVVQLRVCSSWHGPQKEPPRSSCSRGLSWGSPSHPNRPPMDQASPARFRAIPKASQAFWLEESCTPILPRFPWGSLGPFPWGSCGFRNEKRTWILEKAVVGLNPHSALSTHKTLGKLLTFSESAFLHPYGEPHADAVVTRYLL